MKKITTAIFVVTLLISVNANAQSNVIKLNILSPIVRTLNMSFEHTLGDEKSIQIGVAYTGASINDTQFSGIQITPEYRFYLSETAAPMGVYVAPFVRYANLSLSVQDFFDPNIEDKATLSSFGGGLVIGKQWIFKEAISLETFIGPAFSTTSLKVESGTEELFDEGIFGGFGLRIGVNFGYAF